MLIMWTISVIAEYLIWKLLVFVNILFFELNYQRNQLKLQHDQFENSIGFSFFINSGKKKDSSESEK